AARFRPIVLFLRQTLNRVFGSIGNSRPVAYSRSGKSERVGRPCGIDAPAAEITGIRLSARPGRARIHVMNSPMTLGLCGFIALLAPALVPVRPQAAADETAAWNQKGAAAYLDQRSEWWSTWQGSARDHGTFC